MIGAVETLRGILGLSEACAVVGVPRSWVYRQQQRGARPPSERPPGRVRPARALSPEEEAEVLELLDSERFQDLAPREVYATLLEEGQYTCSWRTMYRILKLHEQVHERRNQRRHPSYRKPELLATQPNQVWSWDITKLRGPTQGVYFFLYVLLDIFSRYVVGWLIAECESAELAEELIAQTCHKQGVERGQLTLHADNGGPMTAGSVAGLMANLGVTKSHSRPHVSNDNPYSEAQFKTLKYRPGYPDRFGGLADARGWARTFFDWYNNRHHHSALGLLTPADVHFGRTEAVLQQRQEVLQQAYERHPERFVQGPPQPERPPEAAWINPPQPALGDETEPRPPGKVHPT